MRNGIKEWLDGALGLFYPPVCQLCEAEVAPAGDGFVGARCRRGVRFVRPPYCERCGLPYEGEITTPFECGNCREMTLHFRAARSAVVAAGVVREVLHRYKYHRALWFEPFLAGLFVSVAGPSLRAEGCDVLVPVPLHPVKRREREFNQSERLARRLGAATGIEVRTDVLRRVHTTPSQTRLSRAERSANVRGAFVGVGGSEVGGGHVVLVDDVLTTGATASACAEVLLALGAREVTVWTVARGA
jgi:competence protein ComFC